MVDKFEYIYDKAKDLIWIHKPTALSLYKLASSTINLEGDVAEVGVYKGGSAILLNETFDKKKTIHLFDTFTGIPKVNKEYDLHIEGDFADTSLEEVKKNLDGENIVFHPGLFPRTTKPVENLKFCFVHADCDIYKSILDCCEFFCTRMIRGGIMVFDDYGNITTPGVKIAIDNFFEGRNELLSYPPNQCVVFFRKGSE